MFCNANNGPGASRHSQSAWPALIKYTLKMLFNNYDICQCRMSTISGHCYGCNCTPNSTALGGMWKCLLHEFTRLWTGKVKSHSYVGGYWTLCEWKPEKNFLPTSKTLIHLKNCEYERNFIAMQSKYVESFSQSDHFKIIYRMPKGFKYQLA